MPTVTDLAGPAGPLEAFSTSRRRRPARAAVVFAHPHPQFGGTMHTKVVYQGAKGLARIGCAVLRFNFRGVGRSAERSTRARREGDDFRAALDYMARALSRRCRSGPPASRSARGSRSRSAPSTTASRR